MSKALIPKVDDNGEIVKIDSVVEKNSETIASQYRVISFRNRPMIELTEPYSHFVPLNKERFDKLAYPILGGVSRSRMNDVFSYLCNTAEDLTQYDHLILFGARSDDLDPTRRAIVWTTEGNGITAYAPELCVWRSPYTAMKPDEMTGPIEFIMQLAGGDQDLYDDIMQSIAPLIMARKPDGVIWWVGDGANGKSTLMDAIYRLFPGQLSSLTVKGLTDGRDTPSLNGTLANVVKESSEGRIDDTEIYKSLGTHENFTVHKFHSQESITIMGNLHHIFNANLIPAFNDKGFSARRRTFIIPFNERFASDPTFEEKTFTDEFFGQLITEMCKYAKQIEQQGYRYKWSAKTLGAKAEYDSEANNAEEYAAELIRVGVVGFDSFLPVRVDYENYCAENGYVPLGVGAMRRGLQAAGFERVSIRVEEHITKAYRLPNFKENELQQLNVMRPGLYTVAGFQAETAPVIPEFDEAQPQEETDTIGSDW
jgi:hypothetical protein